MRKWMLTALCLIGLTGCAAQVPTVRMVAGEEKELWLVIKATEAENGQYRVVRCSPSGCTVIGTVKGNAE